jgi:hypothetical protein
MVTVYVADRGYTVYRVILPGTTSSRTRNTVYRRNVYSAVNCQLKDSEAIGFPLGITISWTRKPPEEWNSAGNHQLMDADSGQQHENTIKILRLVTILG